MQSTGGTFVFDLQGEHPGRFHLDLKTGSGSAGEGDLPSGDPDVTMTMDSADFTAMITGQADATQLFMSGKLKIDGSLGMAMKLQTLMQQMKSKL